MPVLLDYKAIRKNYTADDELTDLATESDAELQVEKALDRVEKLIGKRPKGVWCAEQCVSQKTLDLYKKLSL